MKTEHYQVLDEVARATVAELTAFWKSDPGREMIHRIRSVLADLPECYSTYVGISFQVFDDERERNLTLRETEAMFVNGRKDLFIDKDPDLCSFVVEGSAATVPAGFCPRCWGPWGQESQPAGCSRCGCTVGEDAEVSGS